MNGDLLDVIEGWPAEEQQKARRIIEEVEEEVPHTPLLERMQASGFHAHLAWHSLVMPDQVPNAHTHANLLHNFEPLACQYRL
jgi:hypothetical protein